MNLIAGEEVSQLIDGYEVKIEILSKGKLKYRASVRINGKYVGRTNLCKTQETAKKAALPIISDHYNAKKLLENFKRK